MVKKRGLGKSLDALLVGSYVGTEEAIAGGQGSTESLQKLSVDVLQRGKYQPRRGMDQAALEELADSIRTQGIIQPIIVREVSANRYEIIAGERRWRAAILAGLTEVPAIIRKIPDEAAVAISLIENIQRENLNPIEESIALQRLMEEFSMTHQQVANAVGKSRTTVTNLLRLLALTEKVKIYLENGDLEMGHARALLTLTEKAQLEAAELIIARGLSVRETEELVRRMQVPADLQQVLPKPLDPDIRNLQNDLSHRLRLPVTIQCNPKGKGRLVIRYSNLTELDKLLEYFEVG
jgi:ParB family chromosome partitioning protein